MKILYLYGRKWYDKKMSRGRVQYAKALAKTPGVELVISGEGWNEYNKNQTVLENCERLGWQPDWVWVYKGEDYKGLEEVRSFVTFNEANAEKTRQEMQDASANAVVFHHEVDIPQWKEWMEEHGIAYTHILHCAPYGISEMTRQWNDRRDSCLLTGVMSPEVYPLRARFQRMIDDGRIPGVVRKHPGYRLQTAIKCDTQFTDYACQLGRFQISLVCSSKYKYPLAKYVESFMAGCLVVGDMPNDSKFQRAFGSCFLDVNGMEDDEIAKAIDHCLKHQDHAHMLAQQGQRIAKSEFTQADYANRLVNFLASVK